MRRLLLATALAILSGQAVAQTTSPARNGVIRPEVNVDPGMKVMPPRTHARIKVVHPPGTRRTQRKQVIVVPK